MTKRSAEQAIRDELEAERALLARLEEQETKRKEALAAAMDARDATRRAMEEAKERILALEYALKAVSSPADPDPEP